MSRQRSVFMGRQGLVTVASSVLGVDLAPGRVEQAGERGDRFLHEGVDALLLVGGVSGAELGDGAVVLGLGCELAYPGCDGRADGGARGAGGRASRG
jgi:hypothetical protein